MPKLSDLPFTSTALERAERYGHAADDYHEIDPAGAGGKYLVSQVETVEADRQAKAAGDFEPIDAGTWNGFPNYGCPYCALTSLNQDRVRQHIWRAHRGAR